MGSGTAPGSSGYAYLSQRIEGFNTSDLLWGTVNARPVTLSFWVNCSIVGTFGVSFRNGIADTTYCTTYTINSTNTWEYKTVTVPGVTTGTWFTDNRWGIEPIWDLGVGTQYSGTAGQVNSGSNYFGVTGTTKLSSTTGATFYLTGVQLEAGTVATPFERRSYGQELALCQRYFEIQDVRAVTTAYVAGGYNYHVGSVRWKVTKRTAPTTNTSAIANYQPGGGSGTASVSNQTVDGGLFLSGSTNTTFPNQWVNDNSILTISAEL
jgi:hypothetical protein